MTTTQFSSFNPASPTLFGREVTSARQTTAARTVRQPIDPPALWQQSLRVNDGRSILERIVGLLLVLLAVAAIAYAALVTARTFRGDHFQAAVGRIANHAAR